MSRRVVLPLEPPAAPPGAHRLEIIGWLPPRLNQFTDRHWSVRKRAKDGARAMIGTYIRLGGTPPARGKRRVSLWICLPPGRRRPDPDAYWKVTLDCLVAAKALVDDGPRWCELGPVEYGRGPVERIVMTLEDLN